MKYTIFVIFAVAFGLMAGKCEQGSSVNSADPAWCKTHYQTQELCEMNANCRWVMRPDGREVCKAK